jgi:hypothetical protein
MKYRETEPSQATGSGGCVGGANLIGRFRLVPLLVWPLARLVLLFCISLNRPKVA